MKTTPQIQDNGEFDLRARFEKPSPAGTESLVISAVAWCGVMLVAALLAIVYVRAEIRLEDWRDYSDSWFVLVPLAVLLLSTIVVGGTGGYRAGKGLVRDPKKLLASLGLFLNAVPFIFSGWLLTLVAIAIFGKIL